MHYLYRYVYILMFCYTCIWTIVCNKEFIIFIILMSVMHFEMSPAISFKSSDDIPS